MGTRKRKLRNLFALQNRWVEAYPDQLRPKLVLGRFQADDFNWWKDVDIKKYEAFWGGEVAAAMVTQQLAELFDKDSDTIGLHIRNIYKEGELSRKGNTEQSSVVQKEGNRQVRRKVNFYNLDVIISVGYRVKSKRGIQFRQMATFVLRGHLVRRFTLNEKRLREQEQKLADLRRTVGLLEQTLIHKAIGLDEAKGLLQVITDYAYALTTLDRFDHGTLTIEHRFAIYSQ